MDLHTSSEKICDESLQKVPISLADSQSVITRMEEVSSKCYAVSFPPSLTHLIDKDHPLIFQNKIDALKALKQYPDARFREFNSRLDAVSYASVPLSPQAATSLKENGEKMPFKSITSQEMVQLRKAIESGNEAVFLEKVWSNPRYLINSADGPTVMQEGTRYNALHVATRFKQTGMCLTILSVIHDEQFVSTLYPDDKPPMIKERVKHLVDLYLNMPDKSLSETPVHFACKFGVDSILAILLSYPGCDTSKLNKYEKSPKDIICDRHVCGFPDHKKLMHSLFEDVFYVPIMRDEIHNFVGEPCRAYAVLTATSCSLNEKRSIYCAFAGPMSMSAAKKFCTLLKTKRIVAERDAMLKMMPFSPEEKTMIQICLSDSKKGLERIGRKLAQDFSTGWLEFWTPWDCWLDLSSDIGFNFLNSYLKKQDKEINSDECDSPVFTDLITSFTDDFVHKLPVIVLNMTKMTFFHLFQTFVPYMSCFTKFTFSQEKEISLIHEEVGHLLYLKISSADKNCFDALKFYLNTMFNVVGGMQTSKCKMFLCVLKFACYFRPSNAKFLKLPTCNCQYAQEDYFYDYSAKFCYDSVLSLREKLSENITDDASSVLCTEKVPTKDESSVSGSQTNETVRDENHGLTVSSDSVEKTVSSDTVEKTDEDQTLQENVESPLSALGIYSLFSKLKLHDTPSPKGSTLQEEKSTKLASSEEEEEFFTPPESPQFTKKNVFINSQDLSDDDIDIFRAIVDAGIRIDNIEYPYLFKWKCLMESTLKPVLKLDDKVTCTPPSSSASVRQTVRRFTLKKDPSKFDSLKRTLF